MRVLFVFIDGLGLGSPRGDENPLVARELPALERLAGGQRLTSDAAPVISARHVFRAIDATLGLEGLPQSGTGQAALFTGVNCVRLAGRHYGPYPHSQTRAAIAEKNVFRRVAELGFPDKEPVAFANAYPERFFEYVRKTDRWTVTTRCCLDAGVRIRTSEDLRAGRALPADLIGSRWPDGDGRDLIPADEADAALRLVRIAAQHRFTLFEYYMTDKAGHAQSARRAARVLRSLDRFFDALLPAIDSEDILLLVTSDHGNIEDLSTKGHTTNPVPLIAVGPGAERFAEVEDLTGVVPAIMDVLKPPPRSKSARPSSAR